MTKLLLTFFLILLAISPVAAQENTEPTFDEINEVAKDLNCPTCQGVSLSDCQTQTCEQWKGQIGDLLAEGYTEQEVLDFFATRYGEQVLQRPPMSGFTLLLWLLPLIALAFGAIWYVYVLRDWKRDPIPAPGDLEKPLDEKPVISDEYMDKVDKDLGL